MINWNLILASWVIDSIPKMNSPLCYWWWWAVRNWAIPGLERNRVRFFPHESRSDEWGKINSSWITNGTFLLPHEWLSRLRCSWGIFFSSRLLSHSWGSKNVPFVIHEELFFPHSSLRDSWGKNPSLFLSRPGMAHIRMSASLAQLLKIHKMLLTKVIAHMSFRYFFGITSLGHVPQCLLVGAT